MEVLGYLATLAIGVTLGLIGGGGSILTLPVLVYLFGINPSTATSYSLFIVGVSSLVGGIRNWRKKNIDISTIILFAPASVITVILTRSYIEPLIPHSLFSVFNFIVTKNAATMFLFAVLMIATAVPMLRPALKQENNEPASRHSYLLIVIYGVLLGLLTGFLGAGGGFFLIPVLVTLLKLPVKTAIGTSLMIIALNSLIGFAGSLYNDAINWPLLLRITALAVMGILAGASIGATLDGLALKKGFGWFVLVMGCYILVHELTG